MEIKSYKVCLAVQINLFQSSIIQGAMLEAAKQSRLGSRDLGFKHVLFLSDCRGAAQVVNNSQITSSWQEKSLMSDSDWSHLLAADFVYLSVFVPRVVTTSAFSLAKLATKMPINCYSVL